MNEKLVVYVRDTDPSLVGHLDDDGELAVPTARTMLDFLSSLSERQDPVALDEDWRVLPSLVRAFVFAYGSEDLDQLSHVVPLMRAGHDEPAHLTELDRRFLRDLSAALGAYVRSRS
jgi:hypothetical protein